MKNRGFRMLFLVAAVVGSMQLGSCSKETSEDKNVAEDKSASFIEKTSTSGSGNSSWIDGCIGALPSEPLSVSEIDALTVMREEELLAKDVYELLFTLYNHQIFSNISESETQHALAVKTLLIKYGLTDPAENHVAGVFSNTDLQEIYNSLIALGTTSLISAFTVGATIEDMDISDLENHITNDVDNLDILFVFENLEKGSRNHMRSFYSQLSIRGVTYIPQFISQETLDLIINTPYEAGSVDCPD